MHPSGGREKSKDIKQPPDVEQMVTSQQHHNVNSLKGETLDCSLCEAQTLANAMCNFNETFKTEDDFTNPWQQSMDINENKEFKFSRETEEFLMTKNAMNNMHNNAHQRKD